MQLKELGKYKVERGGDYYDARKCGMDTSYYELIRVRGSKVQPCFTVPSHLYKYSEDTFALYLNDHKKAWRQLSKLLNHKIDMKDKEATFKFSVEKFRDVSKIVKFVNKRGNGTIPDNLAIAREKSYFKHGLKVKENKQKLSGNASNGIITLERFKSGEK